MDNDLLVRSKEDKWPTGPPRDTLKHFHLRAQTGNNRLTNEPSPPMMVMQVVQSFTVPLSCLRGNALQ